MGPIIGITATLKEDVDRVAERPLGRFVRSDYDYVEGVAGAGGVPVVLPPVGGERAAEAVIGGLDGLLLAGGSDLDPGYYGERPSSKLGPTVPERDAFEVPLVALALRRGIPVFGVCRGMQLLNVALGGTLFQDIPSEIGRDVLKHRQETPKWEPTHEVGLREDSWVRSIIQESSVEVNSYHHQGVKDLADSLVVSASPLTGSSRPWSRVTSRTAGSSGCSGTRRRCATSGRSSASSSRLTSPPASATPACAPRRRRRRERERSDRRHNPGVSS